MPTNRTLQSKFTHKPNYELSNQDHHIIPMRNKLKMRIPITKQIFTQLQLHMKTDFVPFVTIESQNGPLKCLIDTGANKSFISPIHAYLDNIY